MSQSLNESEKRSKKNFKKDKNCFSVSKIRSSDLIGNHLFNRFRCGAKSEGDIDLELLCSDVL